MKKSSLVSGFLYGFLSMIVFPLLLVQLNMLLNLSSFNNVLNQFVGAILVIKVRYLLPYLLAFAAGAMIYVVVQELIPESQTNKKKELMALFTLIGFSFMMILDVALS